MINYNFKELVQILTKIYTNICLLMPYKCTKFQPDQSTHLRVRADFVICAKIKTKKEKKKNLKNEEQKLKLFFPGLDGLPFLPLPAQKGMCWTTEKYLLSCISETPGAIYFNLESSLPL